MFKFFRQDVKIFRQVIFIFFHCKLTFMNVIKIGFTKMYMLFVCLFYYIFWMILQLMRQAAYVNSCHQIVLIILITTPFKKMVIIVDIHEGANVPHLGFK